MSPRGRPPSDDPKTKRLVIQATPSEHAEIHDAAREEGKEFSAWARDALLEKARQPRAKPPRRAK